MIDLKFIISMIFPVILQYFIFNVIGNKNNFYKIPQDIREKINSNPKTLTNLDREVLFDLLKIKSVSNETIDFISKHSKNSLKDICLFSKLENKYLKFNENNIIFVNKLIINGNISLTKKVFEIIYYILSFVSLHLLVHHFLINKITFVNIEWLFLLSVIGIFLAIKSAVHSISIEMADNLANLSNDYQANNQSDNLVAI